MHGPFKYGVLGLFLAFSAQADVTFVARGAIDQNGNDSSSSPTNCIPGIPSNIQANDILVLISASRTDTDHTVNNGYTHLASATDTVVNRMEVHWKRTTGSESQTTVTHNSPDSDNSITCVILAFRGAEEIGSPWNINGTVASASGTTLKTTPAITTSIANAMVIHAIHGQNSSVTHSNWSDEAITEVVDDQNQLGPGSHSIGVAYGIHDTASSTGDQTVNVSLSAASLSWLGALSPESAPTAPPEPVDAAITGTNQFLTFCGTACDAEKLRTTQISITPASMGPNNCAAEQSITIPGAAPGDECVYSDAENDTYYSNCFVISPDTIRLRWCNPHNTVGAGNVLTNVAPVIFKSGGLRATKDVDLSSIPGETCVDTTFDLAGAQDGMPCVASVPSTLPAGLGFMCWVASPNVSVLRVCNLDDISSSDPALGTFSVRLMHTKNGWGKHYVNTWDPVSVAAGTEVSTSWTITSGAGDSEPAFCGIPNSAMLGGLLYHCWASATNTVRIRIYNVGTVTRDVPNSIFSIVVDR